MSTYRGKKNNKTAKQTAVGRPFRGGATLNVAQQDPQTRGPQWLNASDIALKRRLFFAFFAVSMCFKSNVLPVTGPFTSDAGTEEAECEPAWTALGKRQKKKNKKSMA